MINHRGRPGLQSSWLDDQLCGFTPRAPNPSLLPDGGGATAGKEEDFGVERCDFGENDEHQSVDAKFRCVQASRVSVALGSDQNK